jgi:eukaryotic translation initiation factor 2C
MVKGGLSSKMAASSLDIVLPSRPAYGIAGRPIVLYTNFFELKGTKADTHLYRYSLSFGDDKVSKVRKKRLIELLLAMPPFSEVKVASDWSQKLVSMEKLSLDKAYTVIWYPQGGEPFAVYTADEDSRLTTSRRKHTYQIKVEDLGTVSLADLLRDVSEPTFKYPLKLEAIDALNIVMTYGPSTQLSITAASGNTFYPFGSHPQAQSTELGGALQAYRGYFTSVRTSVSRLLVNVNVATGAFYKPGPLIDLMTQVCGRVPENKDEHGRVASFVKRVKVETNYTRDSNDRNKENVGTIRKVHSIFGLSHYGGNSTNVTFKNVVNSKVTYPTVQQYFMQKHNITLSRPQAPLVNYGSSDDPKWLPVELCKVVPGQLVRHLLSPQQTSAMITFAARRPYANAESITGNGLEVTMINPVVNGQNINLSAFGIKSKLYKTHARHTLTATVDPSMLTVPGRILAPPVVQYRATTTASPSNGTWNLAINNLCKEPFRVARKLGAW